MVRNRRGDELLALLATPEDQLENPFDAPLTHSFVVAKSERGWLLVFNRRRAL
jgi:hypothetical protein